MVQFMLKRTKPNGGVLVWLTGNLKTHHHPVQSSAADSGNSASRQGIDVRNLRALWGVSYCIRYFLSCESKPKILQIPYNNAGSVTR